jgi:hypothetical protein
VEAIVDRIVTIGSPKITRPSLRQRPKGRSL